MGDRHGEAVKEPLGEHMGVTERMLGKRGWGSVWLNRHLRAETEADWDDVTATNRLLCLGGACRTVTADCNWVSESLHCWKLHAKRYTLCTYISQTYKVFAKFFFFIKCYNCRCFPACWAVVWQTNRVASFAYYSFITCWLWLAQCVGFELSQIQEYHPVLISKLI